MFRNLKKYFDKLIAKPPVKILLIYGNDILRWDNLGKICQSKFNLMSVIVILAIPTIVKIFSSANEVINVPLGNSSINLLLQLPFSWLCLYFSALALLLANISFSLFCPSFLKKYQTFSEYTQEGGSKYELCQNAILAVKHCPDNQDISLENLLRGDSNSLLKVSLSLFTISHPEIEDIQILHEERRKIEPPLHTNWDSNSDPKQTKTVPLLFAKVRSCLKPKISDNSVINRMSDRLYSLLYRIHCNSKSSICDCTSIAIETA